MLQFFDIAHFHSSENERFFESIIPTEKTIVSIVYPIVTETKMEEFSDLDDSTTGFLFAQNVDFILDSLALFKEHFDGDFTSMLIFFTMARASVGHLNREKVPRAEATSGVFPDDLRRPVAILSISDYLGLPYETTRRHVMKLVDRGYCHRRGSREFLISANTLSLPAFRALAGHTLELSKAYLHVVRPYLEP